MTEFSEAASRMLSQFLDYLPTAIGALLLLTAGLLVARFVRAGGMRLVHWANGMIQHRLGPDRARHLRISSAGITLLGNVTYWLIVLVFVTAASRILGLAAFSAWLNSVVTYLPTLLAGGLIIVVGLLISTLARDLTTATAASAGLPNAELFGRGVHAVILVAALVIGINQIGIDVTLLITLIAIVVGAVVGSLALAFALGARSFVGNLIGAHYMQRHYRPGQQARLGDVEGEILELTPVGVVLATSQGRAIVPAKVFSDQVTTLLTEARGDE